MKQFLKRDGTTTDHLPRLEDYIEDDPKQTVKQTYAVQLLDEDLKVVATEFLYTGDYPAFAEMCKRHSRERIEAMAEGEKGGTYLYDMFRTELLNHEYGYTVDTSDALDSLGLTREDLEKNPALKEALEKAAADIRKEEGFEW